MGNSNYWNSPYQDVQNSIDHLLKCIQKIPGKKILTLATDDPSPFTLEILDGEQLGDEDAESFLLKIKLGQALRDGGGLILRQFLPIKFERALANKETQWVPRKNLYGVFLGEGTWRAISAHELRESHCTDFQTGKKIPPEEGVSFRDFPT